MMEQQISLFFSTLQMFWGQVAVFVPKLLAAMVLLFVGWVFARLLRTAARKLLDVMHFEQVAEKSGLEALARSGGIHLTLSEVIAGVLYWLALLIVALSVANSLGLDVVAGLLNRVVLYLPNILIAVLILIFGSLVARVVNRTVFAWLHGIKVPHALAMSTTSEYAVQAFALFMALEQLAIATQLLVALFSIAFGGLVLTLALAFGLGGRDWAAERLRTWFPGKSSQP
jgi:hypothetical protein